MIPVSAVRVEQEAERLILDVLRSGRLTQGPMVARLEQAYADFTGAPHAVAASSATAGLTAALEILGLPPGTEVLTSPFVFAGTLNAILAAGASARFADISAADFCLDPAAAAAAVTGRTAVLLPVYRYGQVADLDRLLPLARRHGMHLVEGGSQSHGATIGGRTAGSFGLGVFSFHGSGSITTGEGGIITTGDDELAERLRVLRDQGMRDRNRYGMVGHNLRLSEVQAALAIPQLARHPEAVERRRRNAAYLSVGLADLDGLVVPGEAPGRGHVWNRYTVLITDDAPAGRDEIAARLARHQVGSGVYHPRLVHDHPCYRDHPRVVVTPTPVAERITRQCLSLPVHQHLSEGDLDTIIGTVRRVWQRPGGARAH